MAFQWSIETLFSYLDVAANVSTCHQARRLLSSRDVAMNEPPGKVKDSTEKYSMIEHTYRHTYSTPILRMPVSNLYHGALFSNIFNFAKCMAHF